MLLILRNSGCSSCVYGGLPVRVLKYDLLSTLRSGRDFVNCCCVRMGAVSQLTHSLFPQRL